jgi:hypothetical protein
MPHRIFRITSVLSLILFLVTCMLWIRSYSVASEHAFITQIGEKPIYFYILSQSGGVVLKATSNWPTESPGNREASWASCRVTETWERPFNAEEHCRSICEFRAISGEDEFYDNSGHTLSRPGVAVSFPFAALGVAFLVLPAARVLLLVRSRWRRQHLHCLHCGYDLRVTPLRCPECGRGNFDGAERFGFREQCT